MTDKELIQQLSDLSYTKAPKSFKRKVTAMVGGLPDIHRGFYFPLFALQMAIVGVVLVVLVGFDSGVVVAAKAQPGTPFFPVKEIFYTIIPQIVGEKALTPTPVIPTPTIAPTTTVRQKQQVQVTGGIDEKGEEHEDNFFSKTIKKIQDVKGAHTQQRRNEGSKDNGHQKGK